MLQQNFASYWKPSENRLRAGDVNEILAWIDYCIIKRLGPHAFEKSIVAHLSHTCYKNFSFKQIDDRIKNLWRDRINSNLPTSEVISGHTVVYRLGTKALLGRDLKDDTGQIVKARVQQLIKQPVPKYAKPSTQSLRKKRKGEHISADDGVAKRLQRTKRSRLDSGADSIPRISPRDSIYVQIPPTPTKSAESVHARQNHRALSAVPKDEQIPSLRSATSSPMKSIIEESESGSMNWCVASSEVFLTPPREMLEMSRTRTAASPLIRSAQNNPSCNLSECETFRQLLSDCERDLQHLRGRLSEAHRTIEELQTKLSSEEHRRAICENAAGAPTQETLRGYLAEIEILRSQILNKEVFIPFTTRDIRKHMPFDKEYFQNHMLDIKNEVEDFMCRYHEISGPCNDIKLRDSPDDLRALLHRVLGNSRDTLQAISFHSLLRSIISAAVCQWVLECDVREPMITGGLLRDTMLSHLTTMDGENVARNLDFAAHHNLIESKDFQNELIPRRAEALAGRLSDTVEPLFRLQNPIDLWQLDILKEWRQQRPTLKQIFVSALKVKTKALVSKDIFEVIFPVPGCKYDPEQTEVERLERENGRSELGQSHIVRICLVPGLKKYVFDRKLVDYNSFRRPSTSSAEPGYNIASPLIISE